MNKMLTHIDEAKHFIDEQQEPLRSVLRLALRESLLEADAGPLSGEVDLEVHLRILATLFPPRQATAFAETRGNQLFRVGIGVDTTGNGETP